MDAARLYKQLEKDFIKPELTDDWMDYMASVSDFLSENFKKRSMGLVCDFATEIRRVYTAVFPSKKVMQRILADGAQDAMLFVHHPAAWDIRKAPEVWQQMDRELLQRFKERRIAVYNLHVPLDNYGEYSTSITLAKVLGIKPEKSFALYFGGLCGVFGKTKLKTVQELKKKFESVAGHKIGLRKYGDDRIKNKHVAIIAGGGNEVEYLKEIIKAGINTFVAGITIKNDHSRRAHEFAEKHRVNILGGTHYSTEKFACQAMCEYFKKHGLASEFIEDAPVMEDM